MKMVRSLLLGSAAGFVAVAGAQAADMPVKAKPVEYVKICTLYGAGFYYLPGTDICIKHGAYVRFQPYYNAGGTSATNGPFIGNAVGNAPVEQSRLSNSGNDLIVRSRAVYTMDARTQTEYGTLRAYALIGYSQDWPGNQIGAVGATLYATRGFIQFAGFTLGKATSFYDIWSVPANSYFAVWSSDTGDSGNIVASYTFQFGNGFSATLSAEDPRRAGVVNASNANGVAQGAVVQTGAQIGLNQTVFSNTFLIGATPTTDQVQVRYPDVVANLRVDQAWGSFQVMGALHDASGGYFTTSGAGAIGAAGFSTCTNGAVTGVSTSQTGQAACGHPDDELGFAVGAGGIFKIPMPTGLTDIASFQVNYTEGAMRYAVFTQPGAGSPALFGNTGLGQCPAATSVPGGAVGAPCLGSVGAGFWTDAIYGNPGLLPGYDGSVQRTKVWGVNAAWDHLWTPNLKTSVYGSFHKVDYNATATALIAFATCGAQPGAGNATVGPVGRAPGSLTNMTNCNPDFAFWQVGSRTQWNITPSFYVGFDVMYQKLETAFEGAAVYAAVANLPRPTGNYEVKDQNTVSFTARAHWDILP